MEGRAASESGGTSRGSLFWPAARDLGHGRGILGRRSGPVQRTAQRRPHRRSCAASKAPHTWVSQDPPRGARAALRSPPEPTLRAATPAEPARDPQPRHSIRERRPRPHRASCQRGSAAISSPRAAGLNRLDGQLPPSGTETTKRYACARSRITSVKANRSGGHARSSSVIGWPATASHEDASAGSSVSAMGRTPARKFSSRGEIRVEVAGP